MSNYVNQAIGSAKEGLGNLTGNKDLQESGRKQWAEAKGEQKLTNDKAMREEEAPNAHRAADAAKGMGGAAKEKLGQAIGNDKMAAEGRSTRAQAAGEASHHENLAKK
ncbi:hypothetical protein LPJ73_000153 [Coemansia sp. RSA 2703]|nr:hypothetical protein LPJ73_000153 [Coemansia sp. RSA 2703]KAJ2379283.1 hypothetical protein IW150_000267 [Coemansia sp. RSA 2607]KAJ2398363.1 hypothetical protein GGI05_000137 [Coemansia sp. RSA 2603]